MNVYIIGAGMGDEKSVTCGAKEIIENADIIIGPKRLTERIHKRGETFNCYKPSEIKEYLKGVNFKSAAVLLSGDTGFYSGAKKLIGELKEYDVKIIPGVTAAAYFCSKLKIPWEDIKLLSMHGKTANIIGYIKKYKRVFALLSGREDIKNLCGKLCFYGMGKVILHIGQRLSYNDEKIITARAEDIKEFDFDDLSVVLAENENFCKGTPGCIDDNDFIRGNVPMTKSEIRTLSIAKLGLYEDSIIYDAGAGTGSIAVEAALKAIDGKVYAIEKEDGAIEIIEKNKRKFAADNIEIVKGTAPDAFESLPKPTHVFIGGSSGHMKEIICRALEKNPFVKIVINAVSLNTVSEIINIVKEKNLIWDALCVNISKKRNIGGYDFMTGYNSVYIFTVKGE